MHGNFVSKITLIQNVPRTVIFQRFSPEKEPLAVFLQHRIGVVYMNRTVYLVVSLPRERSDHLPLAK